MVAYTGASKKERSVAYFYLSTSGILGGREVSSAYKRPSTSTLARPRRGTSSVYLEIGFQLTLLSY